jgi:ankyrin repeat protein
MINAGTDVFLSDYDQRTAMHLAASAGHTEMVRLLIGSVATT